MIEFEITEEWRKAAKEKANNLGRLRRSIRKGEGNFVGFLGEHLAQNVLGGTFANTYNYDLLLDNGVKVDVKTKTTSVVPRAHYECSVADYYLQKCDYYVFVRILNDFSRGWLLGYKSHDDFITKGRRVRKGDYDKSNNFVARLDGYNMAIKDLDTKYERITK